MEVKINSHPQTLKSPVTLLECLQQTQIQTQCIAVAVNFVCIPRSQWETHQLQEQDEIEILSPQQGG